MMHEVMHCALDHMERGKYHDQHKSNIAADYEVNGNLVDSGVVSASDVSKYLYDPKYSGWAYETIYADNPSGPAAPPMQQGGQQDGSQGQGQGQGQSGDGSSPMNEQHSPEYVDGWNDAIRDYLPFLSLITFSWIFFGAGSYFSKNIE